MPETAGRTNRLSRRRKVACTALVLLMLVAGLELAGRVIYFNLKSEQPLALVSAWQTLRSRFAPPPAADGTERDERRRAPEYHGVAWADAYWDEFAASFRTAWVPYVYWRRIPFTGRFINVDASGHRNTVPPTHPAEHDVWALGGSTMWGSGVTDEWTIPSCMVRLRDSSGRAIRVLNLGEAAWTGSQSLVYLQELLKKGGRPDVVILYCGINGILSASASGRPDLPYQELDRARQFQIRRDETQSLVHLGPRVASLPELATGVADQFRENGRYLQALGEQFGFRAISVWQPVLCIDKPLAHEYERTAAAQYPHYVELAGPVYEQVRQAPAAAGFADISGIFRDIPDPLYIDLWHVGARGNQLIAERLVDLIAPALDGPAHD